jgi:cold shock CspA family protein
MKLVLFFLLAATLSISTNFANAEGLSPNYEFSGICYDKLLDIHTGVVKSLSDKGTGYIKDDKSGKEYIFHLTSYDGKVTDLKVGIRVSFTLATGANGPRAENIRLIKDK